VKQDQPVVTIIMPFHNAAPHLAEAIDSVLAQSFTGWRLVLVDDGSTDRSRIMANVYRERFPRQIKVISHADGMNHGIAATRNLGLSASRSEFIALLDADDVWAPTKLAEQLDLFLRHPSAGMVFGRSLYWRTWDASCPQGRDDIPTLAPGSRLYAPGELTPLTYPFGKFGSPCPSSLMIRRSSLQAVGGFASEFLGRAEHWEDIAFLAKLFLGCSTYVSNECWDSYRIRPDSVWSRAKERGDEDFARRFFMDWFTRYLAQTDIVSPKVVKVYRLGTWRYRHPRIHRLAGIPRKLARQVIRRL
jgi:glycosyltransferase involved in cell wall biosynthesis